jgi:hypothetical protein
VARETGHNAPDTSPTPATRAPCRRTRPSASSVPTICGRRFFHEPLPVKRAASSPSESGSGEAASRRATAATCAGSVAGERTLPAVVEDHVRLPRLCGRLLVIGTQPADVAFRLFRRAFGVERDQADEHRFLSDRLLRRVGVCSQLRRQVAPAIGIEHGGVEFVVQRFQHAHQPLLVDGLVLRVERIAAAEFFEHALYMPVSVSAGCTAYWRLRCASSCSARSGMRVVCSAVGVGKGKASKQDVLL